MEDSPLKSKKSPPAPGPFDTLVELIERLRGDDGCPWDKKQTPRSIAVYLVEEIFELFAAIISDNPEQIREELGDVLFQIFFVAGLYQERGLFDIKDVVNSNAQKMIRRHPHVFGNENSSTAEKIRMRWHEIKMKEKKRAPDASILDSVPSRLPALMRAYRISERAARTGFDWPDLSEVMHKAEEEWSELKSALNSKNVDHITLELGDLLFTLTNVARFVGVHPELALAASIRKFERRFKTMEKVVSDQGRALDSLTLEELDILWEEAKADEGG
ncbi:MAG: nucleoside triphosphate pyrophosphohydrolase [Desulfobacterales bacterium]